LSNERRRRRRRSRVGGGGELGVSVGVEHGLLELGRDILAFARCR
jgi:hypothetical protein